MRMTFSVVAGACLVACTVGGGMAVVGDGVGNMGEDAGKMLVDAGSWLIDAGAGMKDASEREDGSAQAQGSETHEIACDDEFARSQSFNGTTTVTTNYFAVLTTETESITGVDVVLCGRQVTGQDPLVTACPAGYTCTGKARPDTADCVVGVDNEIAAAAVRVTCGYKMQTTAGATVSNLGAHYTIARVTIRR